MNLPILQSRSVLSYCLKSFSISFLLGLVSCGGDINVSPSSQNGSVGAGPIQTPGPVSQGDSISLQFLGRYESGVFDESAAEIVAFDKDSNQIFVVNSDSSTIDIVNASAPAAPVLSLSINVARDLTLALEGIVSQDDLGAINSVTTSNGVFATAVESANKQANGYVAFYESDGTFLSAVQVGPLPDMLTYTPDGNTVLVANEGEPSDDYSNDPQGSVSVINVRGGEGNVTQRDVRRISFTDFNVGGSRSNELPEGLRISGRSLSVAQDLEPEYITVSADSSTAWVALQENNGLAQIDLISNRVSSILSLGFKDHAVEGNGLDASNRDDAINIQAWPLRGLFMPDGIASYEVAGVNYVVTANEGDTRELVTETDDEASCLASGGFAFDDGDCFIFVDELRIEDIADTGATINIPDLTIFAANIEALTEEQNLGRIKIASNEGASGCFSDALQTSGQPGPGCVYDGLYSFGTRSFSIWNSASGALVFDSGDDFESITADFLGGAGFNSPSDENEGDNRSDDHGPEPEAIELALINGRTYAFIGLSQVGGIMIYDVTVPQGSTFVDYVNTRNFNVDIDDLVDAGDFSAAGDLGPESIVYISPEDSPVDSALVVVGNEVSGTVAIFEVNVSSSNN